MKPRNPILRNCQKHIEQLPLGGEALTTTRRAEVHSVGGFQFFAVSHDDVMGKGVHAVIEGWPIHAKLPRHKGNKDGRGATTICTAGKTFVSTEGDGDAIYLYVYENACPAAVSFVRGEDNSVSASGTFILNDGFDASSHESLEEFFGEAGAVIKEISLD